MGIIFNISFPLSTLYTSGELHGASLVITFTLMLF